MISRPDRPMISLRTLPRWPAQKGTSDKTRLSRSRSKARRISGSWLWDRRSFSLLLSTQEYRLKRDRFIYELRTLHR
jgi:hypothetical protein